MDKDEINKEILKASGWRKIKRGDWEGFWRQDGMRKGRYVHWSNLPEPITDRNAVHDAIAKLTADEFFTYQVWLHEFATVPGDNGRGYYCAPPDMMAEALLRSLGKWKEE